MVLITTARVMQVANLPEHGLFTKYTAAAADLRAGRLSPTRVADLSPVYLGLVAGVEEVGASAQGLIGLQVAALGLVAFLAGATAWRWAGPMAGFTAAGGVLGSRLALVNATELEPEMLVLVLDVAALWLLARSRPRPLAAGIVLGLSTAARPTGLLVAAVAAVWLLWRARERCPGIRARAAALLVVGLTLPLGATATAVHAVTGSWLLMNPGTVFYEGWNPRATGLTGEVPTVVKDLEAALHFPDALHEAYRVVTQRAAGEGASAKAINRYWTNHALRWIRSAPSAAGRLLARKVHATFSSYAAWDLATGAVTERLLPRVGWLPFGLLAVAALAGALVARHPVTPLLIGFVAARAAVPLIFYASARLRVPTLTGLAILAGFGCAAGWRAWRAGRGGQVTAAVTAVVLVGLALSVPSHAEREDRHAWDLALDARAARARARRATDPAEARAWQVRVALDLSEPAAAAPTQVAVAVRSRLTEQLPPARRFDLGVAAARASDWITADAVFIGLAGAGYRPVRGWALCSSLAYHRARARLHLGDPAAALILAQRALTEAPGDPDVLALAARLERRAGDPTEASRLESALDRLNDPFTAARARAVAAGDAGDAGDAREQLRWLHQALPELMP